MAVKYTWMGHGTHALEIGGKRLIIEIDSFPAANDARFQLRLSNDEQNYVELRQQAGVLRVVTIERGGSLPSTSLPNATASQWWRVTENDGALQIETSDDGKDFTLVHTEDPGQLDLAEMRVTFLLEVSTQASAIVGSVGMAP